MDEINAILLGTNMYDDGYNQALEDVLKIYNEMRPNLANNVYEFGERIEQLKK